jgi:nucleoside-diphosphate-sugar epimerase
MSVFVTGAAGYLGRVLITRLRESGHSVNAIDTNWFKRAEMEPARLDSVSYIDVRDISSQDLSNSSHVMHLAALSNDPLGNIDEALTWEINYEATLNLARRAKAAGVRRFVFFSTCSVYGAMESDELLTESSPTRPITPYAASKLAAEQVLVELSDEQFSVVVLRNGTAFGPSPCPRLDLVLNDFVDSGLRHGQIVLQSDGNAWRPLIDVRDIVGIAIHFVNAVLDSPSLIVNVGHSGGNITIRALAEKVGHILNVPVCSTEQPTHDHRNYRVDFALLERLAPRYRFIRLEDGIRDMRDFWLTSQLESRDRNDFVRVFGLQMLMTSRSLDEKLRWLRR